MQDKFTRQAANALKLAKTTAQSCNHSYIGTEHILYSILKQKNARGTTLLRDLHADVSYIMDELEEYFLSVQLDLHHGLGLIQDYLEQLYQ